MDFIGNKRYQLTDIFVSMDESIALWKAKYYIEDQGRYREIDQHNAIIGKLKGLFVIKAYHDYNEFGTIIKL